MCNRIFEYGILRFECVTRFEYSNQIRMCHEIRILQPDSNVSRDSNTPTRFECVTRFEYFECVMRFEHSNQIRISYEIRILQSDSNVSRDSNDSNIPTRFEYSNIISDMRSTTRKLSTTMFFASINGADVNLHS